VPRVPAQRSETHTKSWTKRVGTGALPLQNDDLSENETALGGHGIVGPDVGWNYWHKHLADSLSYVGKQFNTNLMGRCTSPDPPKSPLIRGTLSNSCPPLIKGG
jgi:hypothetical protein